MASTVSIIPTAKLRMRPLQLCLLKQFRPHLHPQQKTVCIPDRVHRSLGWWTVPANLFCFRSFQDPTPTKFFTTDASLTGWGAHLDGMTVHRLWSMEESPPHTNLLELKAVLLALRSFQPMLKDSTVSILSDNTTAVAYINKQGGMVSRSLCKLVMDLWDFCLVNSIFPKATHVPGVDNYLADSLIRQKSICNEWELNPLYLQPVFNLWGRPEMDAFATKGNTKCTLFCSTGATIKIHWGTAYSTTGQVSQFMPSLPFP